MYVRTTVLALFCILLGMGMSLVFARRLTNPIKILDTATEQVAKGDLTVKADVRTGDELERLANSFNKMTEALAKSQGDLLASKEALQKARDELEQRVKERTFELLITNDQLHQKTEDLIRSNKELEQFAYVASHDLQEPLRMVTSYVQLLERRYKNKLDKDANEFIDFAVDGATRMHSLINDLLTYSRVGTRGKTLEPTDCEAVFDQSVSNLKVAVEESGARVTHDSLPTVMADSSQLEELFQNLIGNAIKFRGEEPPRVHISASSNGNLWVFSVRDNGIGIDPEFKECIFVIFQRLHGKDKYPGTGIGLAVCKKIVECHGGNIWVESNLGKGSTFYFTLRKSGANE
jgi:light-regulated signal transduction histidine kinase (bacteriophytochrome)/HAMP domain-containing protein